MYHTEGKYVSFTNKSEHCAVEKSALGNEGLRRMECRELGSGRRVGDRSEGKGDERMEEQQKKENKNTVEEHKRNSSTLCMFSLCRPLKYSFVIFKKELSCIICTCLFDI